MVIESDVFLAFLGRDMLLKVNHGCIEAHMLIQEYVED